MKKGDVSTYPPLLASDERRAHTLVIQGLAYLLTAFSCQCPAPCLVHPISASEDVYPAVMELQALWYGKTQVTFLTKAETSQTLWHSSSKLSCSGCRVAFMSPSFGPLKVRCLVQAKHHTFLHNQKETGKLTRGYHHVRHLLQSELPWEDLIVRSPLTTYTVCKARQD